MSNNKFSLLYKNFIDFIKKINKSKILKYTFLESILAGLVSGIIVTYGMTEYYEKKRIEELEKFRNIAFNDIGYTIKEQIKLYQDMYKASSFSVDKNDNNIDFFFDRFLNRVLFLDLESNAPVVYINKYTGKEENEMWIYYIGKKNDSFKEDMKYKINQYKNYFKPNEVRMFQKIQTNYFDSFTSSLPDLYISQKNKGKKSYIYAGGEFKKYMSQAFKNYKDVLKFYEKLSFIDKVELFDKKRLFEKNISPKIGSSRLK